MKTIFDLPAHPLLVHLPVVLVPATALAALIIAVKPGWRRRFGPALAFAALVGAVATILAAGSGEELNDALKPRIGNLAADHQSLGETTRLLAILFFVGSAAVAGFDRWWGEANDPPTDAESGSALARRGRIGGVLMAITVVLGLVTTIWMIRTGHEGARIVWDGVLPDEN